MEMITDYYLSFMYRFTCIQTFKYPCSCAYTYTLVVTYTSIQLCAVR